MTTQTRDPLNSPPRAHAAAVLPLTFEEPNAEYVATHLFGALGTLAFEANTDKTRVTVTVDLGANLVVEVKPDGADFVDRKVLILRPEDLVRAVLIHLEDKEN